MADARNRALEPLQSANESTRLSNYADFDKVLFLNDVVFTYDAAVRLLATEMDGAEYDLACGMDFHAAGEFGALRLGAMAMANAVHAAMHCAWCTV